MRPSQKLNTFISMIFFMKKNNKKDSNKFTLSNSTCQSISGSTVPNKPPQAMAEEFPFPIKPIIDNKLKG
ncbi:hypothetical protein CWC19_18155 [Pseudoalteromonas aurantia]|uniref:Uncharacterized protein n=1 Tax=Pseudoalteromonas aurantia TaxID=43654 RepID=A0A5S3V2S5_9GAMM|nr:hypothetical protein CWC19_18155 [Pseudoalteromonas aurantia]